LELELAAYDGHDVGKVGTEQAGDLIIDEIGELLYRVCVVGILLEYRVSVEVVFNRILVSEIILIINSTNDTIE